MAILNPKEEQLIGEDDDTQYQARRKRTRYSETETLFMQWENGSAPVGEIKRFFRFKKAHYYEKTAEGCVEITRAEYDERNNFDAKDIDRKSKRGIRQTVNSNGIAGRNAVGYSNSNRNTEGTEILSRHTVGEQLRNDAGGSISSNGRNDNGVSDSVDDTQYSIRTRPAPKKTMIGYKVFRVDKKHPGQLLPTKIANPGKYGTPIGVWLDADTGEIARNADGSIKTNTKGRISVKADSDNSGTLAWRPGWHLGQMPEANQMNVENPADARSKKDKILYGLQHDDYVFCECEFAADVDYQLEAFEYGTTEAGVYNHSQAGVPYIPEDGFYKYRTNANPNSSPWYISGAIKVTRVLDDSEVRKILADNGYEYRPRKSGKDINLKEYGFSKDSKGNWQPDVKVDLSTLPARVDYSEEIKKLSGYKRNRLNWNNKTFLDAFRIQQIEDKLDYYRETYDDAQFQQRTSPLTNREVLSIAADGLNLKDLTDGEKTALDIFKKRLDTLRELEDKRIAEGRTYKEQQFGSNVDREAAKKTLEIFWPTVLFAVGLNLLYSLLLSDVIAYSHCILD
jgi:hypothetical protein